MKHGNHLEVRSLTLGAVAIMIAVYISAGEFTLASSTSSSPTMIATAPSLTTDLEMARAAIIRGDLRLAVNHLARQLDRVPDDGDALSLLIQCSRTLVSDATSRGDHTEAVNFHGQLSQRVLAARQDRYQPSAAVTPLDDLTEAERAVQSIGSLITVSADEQAAPRIDTAMRLANEAHHWWKPNDRNQIREALRQLRWVCERGQAVSKDTTGRYYEALNRLKGMVANSDWDGLRAEAGFVQ